MLNQEFSSSQRSVRSERGKKKFSHTRTQEIYLTKNFSQKKKKKTTKANKLVTHFHQKILIAKNHILKLQYSIWLQMIQTWQMRWNPKSRENENWNKMLYNFWETISLKILVNVLCKTTKIEIECIILKPVEWVEEKRN